MSLIERNHSVNGETIVIDGGFASSTRLYSQENQNRLELLAVLCVRAHRHYHHPLTKEPE